MSKIEEGPIYACCSCQRLHYRPSVVEMKVEKYCTNRATEGIVKTGSGVKTHDKSCVCNRCHLSMKRGKVPSQPLINDLRLDEIPSALADLRPLELRLISQRIPFMKLVGLPKGAQTAIEWTINVPSKLQPLVSWLPRLSDTAEVAALKVKRKLCYRGHYMHKSFSINK